MRTKIIEWRQARAKHIADARALNDQVGGENRDFTAEEQAQYDRLMNQADGLRTRIEREEKLLDAESTLEDGEERGGERRPDPTGQPGQADRSRRQMEAFERLLPAWINQDYRGFQAGEMRALQAELDTAGGYLRPPQEFINQLIKAVDDLTFIRQFATVMQVASAESMGIPTLEADPADADWTSELATGSEDSTMSFGKRELRPHPLAKRIKISRKLIRSVPSSSNFVRDRLAYKFGITFEKGCLTGHGAGQPLGIFTASDDGIPTSRDVSTDNTTTAVKTDGLINAKYHLKSQYWPRARWIGHRDFFKMVAKLKDGEGQYLWRESVRVGEPDRLLGFPTHTSEYAPNTFTTGLYVAALGDFSHYWIADAMTLEFQLLQELYAETNQVGMIGRLESDGMPVLGEAFARVKLL